MPETFTTRQLAVIAATNKTVYWLLRITDNLGTEYHWSTGTISAGDGSINAGAQETGGTWTGGEWEVAHTFKIVNFGGITLRRSKSEYGINAPNDVNFSIVNSSNTYDATNFKGGNVRIALVVDDGLGKQVVGSWRFVIKSASPYNQQIDVTCEDFLQQYLRGTYPNTRLISEIFPANTDNTIINDSMCVPEPYGTAYIPLRSVYAGSARYYILGPSTGKTYTISEVRNPRATGSKLTWTFPTFAMTQSTKTAPDTSTWKVFQPIIAASTGGGAVDSPGLWLNGDTFWDIPTKFSEAGTLSITNPADIIRRVLLNIGLNDYDLNGPSFDTARTTFTSWGLTWNFAFYYKEDRAKVLSKLLAMCHACLVIGERISLQVLSATSIKTITSVEVTKPDELGPSSFKYTDSLAEKVSDSGYVAWQQTGESQDLFLKALVPAKSATDYPDSETIELPAVQDSQKIQKLGTLYFQRKLLKSADISANLKGTCLIIRPDDVVTINYADFGGTYNVLIDEVAIKPDCSMDIRAIKFSVVLDDWTDLAPGAITVATDSTTNSYSPVYAGPDSPGSSVLPNALPGRLRIGQTSNYILLDPVSPLRISLYSSDVERMRFGNLNGFLGYVTNLYGIAVGDATNNLKYDPTNGLRISGSITASGTIGGWVIQPTLIQSAIAGAARIELDQTNARISIKDSTNASKTVMGYLNGLAKHDGTGNWGAGDYGFWAAVGDNLKIDGDANYKSGDWIVENDGSYLIQNAAAQTIVRLGTVSGVKGLFVYDATSPTQNLLAKFATDGLYLGTAGAAANYLVYTIAGGLIIKGDITATSGYFTSVTLGKTGVASGTLTLQMLATGGDTYIAAGKTDFVNTDAGFILGLDDSDGDKAKFYIGSSTKYFNWDGTSITILGDIKTAESGERLEFLTSDNKLHFYNSGGTEVITIGAPNISGVVGSIFSYDALAGRAADTVLVWGSRAGTSNATAASRANTGVQGQATTTKSAGANNVYNYGVVGSAAGGDINYGGYFEGTTGPVVLVPSTSANAPTHSATKGTLWVTSAGILYINTDGGTTWQKVGAQ